MQQSGTPSAYAPTPQAFSPMPQTQPHQQTLPSRQPSHSRVPGGAQSMRTTGGNAALSVQDPAIEARRNLALLVGSSEQAGEGLIDQLEREVTAILDTFERAYEKGTIPADLDTMHATLDNLVSILSRSSLGGYSQTSLSNPPSISTTDLENTTKNVQALFKEVQRCKEGAEIVRAGLAG